MERQDHRVGVLLAVWISVTACRDRASLGDAAMESGEELHRDVRDIDAALTDITVDDSSRSESTAPDGTTTGREGAVWTNRYDNARTGAVLTETVLNTSNVHPSRFGLLFSRQVQGQIYAQPLYVPNVDIPGQGMHNVVYVATTHNDVYAFDADDPARSAPLWHVNMGPSIPFTDYDNCPDMQPEIGITSTPVIDLRTDTIYIEAKSKEGGTYFHRLHALDLATGREKFGGPVVIDARISDGGRGVIEFDAKFQLNRPGLLLSNGKIYIAFGSHCDRGVYHGWVLAYDAATLRQVAVYNATRNGLGAGIWQSGTGLSADERGDVYAITGNGTFDATHSPPDLGDSFLRLRLAGNSLEVVDWFTPHNQAELDAEDRDLGNTGPLLLPGTNLVVGGSKQGMLYVVDRDRMGHFNPISDAQIVQSFLATHDSELGHIHGTPVYWNGPQGPTVYLWGEEDVVRAYRFVDGRFETTPVSMGTTRAPDATNGGMLALSARGAAAGTGILWAAVPLMGSREEPVLPGVLRAFDATDLRREIWNSEMNPQRDRLGLHAKFVPPTVANGKVYMATFSNALRVYGLLR